MKTMIFEVVDNKIIGCWPGSGNVQEDKKLALKYRKKIKDPDKAHFYSSRNYNLWQSGDNIGNYETTKLF